MATTGCGDCKHSYFSDAEVLTLLDPKLKNTIKSGCSTCDNQIENTDINAEVEKLNHEFTLAINSKSYQTIMSNVNGINYGIVENQEVGLWWALDSVTKDSLTVINDDSLKISYCETMLGCIQFVPKIYKSGDSLIIKKMLLHDVSIDCDDQGLEFHLETTACIESVESIITLNKNLVGMSKLYYKPNKYKTFFIPLNRDTIIVRDNKK
jgi:hypothetical protein